MELTAFDKLIITRFNERINALVIGVRNETDGSKTYAVEPVRKDFLRHKNGGRIMRITSGDIENQTIKIEKHTV